MSAFLPPQLATIPGQPASVPPIVSKDSQSLPALSLILVAVALFAVLARLDPTA